MAPVHPNNPSIRNPDWARQVFESSRQPRSWLLVGRRLRSSAETIFAQENPVAKRFFDELRRVGEVSAKSGETYDFDEGEFPYPNFDAAHMLVAFAMENLLKGLIVAKGVVTFFDQRIPRELASHNLLSLHQKALPASTITPLILESLTYTSTWRGRYPFPKSIDGFWPMREDGSFSAAGYSWPGFQEEALKYCIGLEMELKSFL